MEELQRYPAETGLELSRGALPAWVVFFFFFFLTKAQAQFTTAAGFFATLPVGSTNWSTEERVEQAHRREFSGPLPPLYCRGRGVEGRGGRAQLQTWLRAETAGIHSLTPASLTTPFR